MPGKLLVIGGAESHDAGDDAILERFVLLAGGAGAHLVVIATAHTSVDYAKLVADSQLVVDLRNATGRAGVTSDKVWKL